MKKGNRLLLLLVGAIVLSNTHVQAESHKTQTWFQKKFKHTREEVKKMWFCLRNQNKCSKKEVAKAKKWLIKTPKKIIVAALAAVGIIVSIYMINQRQKRETLTIYTANEKLSITLTDRDRTLLNQLINSINDAADPKTLEGKEIIREVGLWNYELRKLGAGHTKSEDRYDKMAIGQGILNEFDNDASRKYEKYTKRLSLAELEETYI